MTPTSADDETGDVLERVASGRLDTDGPAIARRLIGRLSSETPSESAHLLILLGVISEGGSVEAREVVRLGLHTYLALVGLGARHRPLRLALLYLLAHFPSERSTIMAAIDSALDPDEASRLDRCLRLPAFDDPATADEAGRCWPSPASLAFTDDEVASTATLRHALAPDRVAASWDADTRALLAYAGAYAVAALESDRE